MEQNEIKIGKNEEPQGRRQGENPEQIDEMGSEPRLTCVYVCVHACVRRRERESVCVAHRCFNELIQAIIDMKNKRIEKDRKRGIAACSQEVRHHGPHLVLDSKFQSERLVKLFDEIEIERIKKSIFEIRAL